MVVEINSSRIKRRHNSCFVRLNNYIQLSQAANANLRNALNKLMKIPEQILFISVGYKEKY